MKKFVSVFTSALTILSVLFIPCSNAGLVSYAQNSKVQQVKSEAADYSSYLKQFADVSVNNNASEIIVSAENFDKINSEISGRTENNDGIIINENDVCSWNFTVVKDGFYNIGLDATAIEDGRNSITYDGLIDGKNLFDGLEFMEISRRWVDVSDEIIMDDNGNQVRPQIKQVFSYHTEWFKNQEGLDSDYFRFYLTAGEHTVTVNCTGGKFAVKSLVVSPFKQTISYDEYLKNNSNVKKYTGETVKVEAENMLWRSSPSIMSQTDVLSPNTTPYSHNQFLLNTTGGANWKYPWDTICWNINVPEEGLYKISLRYRQNYLSGMSVYRGLTVNGEVPFAEADSLNFGYDDDWQISDLKDYYIKLNKGDNEITLSVTMSSLAEIVRELESILLEINGIYRKIVMITGSSPDTNRDYSLDIEYPTLTDEFNSTAKRIDDVVDTFAKHGSKSGQNISTLKDFSRQLREVAERTYTLTRNNRLSAIKSNISTLGAFINTMREQALEIDSIYVGSDDMVLQPTKANFFANVKHKFLRFIASFSDSYYSANNKDGDSSNKTITVWLQGSGRDQMQVLRNMIDDNFTPKTGINVDLKLVATNIVQADFAGKGPDVALGLGVDAPVNYALRGISADISKMDGFEDVIKRFSPDSMNSYKFDGKYYGLPESQSFSVMFCRTDVLSELGVGIPQTWDELVKNTLPVLRQSNFDVGIGTIDDIKSVTGYNIFTTLLYQNGGKIYSDDLKTSDLDSVVAYESFSKALSYYKDYKIPQSYDALNRFRSGEMPVLISGYTFYNTLSVGAPEISGLWEMTLIPGTLKENGKIDRTQIFSSSACILLERSNKKDWGWQFLDWWTSAEMQARYGLEIEAILGESGRYAPANIEATSMLPWSAKQLKILEAQRSECVSLEQMPGSYFTSKAINNAFLTCVLNDNKLPREEIIYWSEQIDLELERKRKEFNY